MLQTNYIGDIFQIITTQNGLLLYVLYNLFIPALTFISSIYLFRKTKSISVLIVIILITPIRIRYSMEWPSHANLGWIIFYIASLFTFLKEPSSKNSFIYSFLSGTFFFIALVENAYHGVMLVFVSIPLVLFSFYITGSHILKMENVSSFFKKFLIFGAIIISALLYQLYVFSKPVQYGDNDQVSVTSLTRSPSDRWAFSARPWHYLIPDIDHPVLGDFATKTHYFIWNSKPYYLTEPFFPKEHTLFLGYTLIALTIFTIWQTYFKKNITGEKRFTVTFFLIIAVTAFIFSMPPYIALNNFKIHFPSHFIYDFLPQFRAYARYGVLVFIANATLAVIGLDYLASKYSGIKRNLLITLISALAIFEFIPGKHLISIDPLPPYVWLQEESKKQEDPIKYMEIPARADYTDHLYTHGYNIEIINPYLVTRGDAKKLENMIIKNENDDQTFCDLAEKLGLSFIFYHEKDLNKQRFVDKFKQTGIITPQLKVAMAESWGSPVFGNHVPKTEADIAKEELAKNLKNILLNDPKLNLIKEYTNNEIIASRPNSNFSADKFDAITVFEINKEYCQSIKN